MTVGWSYIGTLGIVLLSPGLFRYLLSPEGNCESSAREGPLDGLSILLYVFDEPKLRFQFLLVIRLFQSHENLYCTFIMHFKALRRVLRRA